MKKNIFGLVTIIGALSMICSPIVHAEEADQAADASAQALAAKTRDMSRLYINEKTGEVIRVSPDGQTIQKIERSQIKFADPATSGLAEDQSADSAEDSSTLVPRGGWGGYHGGMGGYRGFGGYHGFGGYRGWGYRGWRHRGWGHRGWGYPWWGAGYGYGYGGYSPGYNGYNGNYYGGWGYYGYPHRRYYGGSWYWPLYSCSRQYYPYRSCYCDYQSYTY